MGSVARVTAPVLPVERSWRPEHPLDVVGTLARLRRGGGDPTWQRDGRAVWRTLRTPAGPATQRVDRATDGEVSSAAWGPGAGWAADRLPLLLGAADDVTDFDPTLHPLVHQQWRTWGPGLRTPSTGLVLEALLPAILEQRVTGGEARSAWRTLVRKHGEPAPGPAPAGMAVFPEAEAWRLVPSWEWHRAGVDHTRSSTVQRVVRLAPRLDSFADRTGEQTRALLRAVPGVGVWTAAETVQRSHGDADAVSYGDFHIPKNVVFALTGETDGGDERLAEVLEPWAGHRGRVVTLIELTGISRPARGPRYAPHDFRAM